jgi:membrane protease YdiL (CAAX protease family)
MNEERGSGLSGSVRRRSERHFLVPRSSFAPFLVRISATRMPCERSPVAVSLARQFPQPGEHHVTSARTLVARHDLVVFYLLACGVTWTLASLVGISFSFVLLALCGPAVAALAVSLATGGLPAGRELVGRVFIWRVSAKWYAAIVAIPVLHVLAALALERALGRPAPFDIGDFSTTSLILGVLVVGEELGWRGYLLPRLLKRYSALTASLIVGVLWGLWHLSVFVTPAFPHSERSFPLFLMSTTVYSVWFTWLYLRTRGSVLLATLFHASLNLFSPGGLDPRRQEIVEVIVYGASAIILIAVWGRNLCAGHPRPARLSLEA